MGYLMAAFVVVWVLVCAYVIYIGVRQRQIEEEMSVLEELLDEQKSGS